MKKLVVLAAFVFSAAAVQQAVACDFGREAAMTPAVVVCDDNGCVPLPTQEAAVQPAPAPSQAAPAEQAATPITVAASGLQ